jgi:hypothetical protein
VPHLNAYVDGDVDGLQHGDDSNLHRHLDSEHDRNNVLFLLWR